ncbi:hypothetical protein [Pseudoduganella chitinolytica]|uniref:Bacterial Pleckstrin homology domain-containing protein n=1 Tax=Pseudoduganella chitinolytica TaxID=34070 RepID=A0ABY8BGU9_9BURK|nr:hypothetical protein [Pseudoduganella chitinolytica]WEF35120.1 hypothetical protein PX653_10260 [Pseudoduganella chitinolytica]
MLLVGLAAAWLPPKPGHDPLLGWSAILAIGAVSVATLLLAARRRAIDVDEHTIVIRHSLYTLRLRRADAAALRVTPVASLDELGLRLRRNGIAAFGYYSGWFSGPQGERTFCAASTWPAYLVAVEGSVRCRRIALSMPPELARRLAAWGGRLTSP